MKSFVTAVLLSLSLVVLVNCQGGIVRRPKTETDTVEEHVQVPVEVTAKCSEETWEAVPAVKGYEDYRMDTIGKGMNGFTVMITQHKTTLSARCFQTSFEHDGDNVTMRNVYPTGEEKNFEFRVGAREVEDDANTSVHNANVMIAGASENFTVLITCNPNSEFLNVLVTYKPSITAAETRTINNWLKKSNFPVIGKWGAINFDTCSLTKTYVCNGGRGLFCSSVTSRKSHRGHTRSRAGKDSSSSEEQEQDDCDEDEIIDFMLFD